MNRDVGEPAAHRPTRARFVVLGYLGVLTFILYLDRICIGKVGPRIRDELGISATELSYVFSAFGVGLFANAVLPGRIGELARVAVLARRYQQRGDAWATLVGTVFAHRVFDLFPTLLLVLYVAVTAKIPHWALSAVFIFVAVGFALFAFAWASARRRHRPVLEEASRARRLITMARYGLGVMREPIPAITAGLNNIA